MKMLFLFFTQSEMGALNYLSRVGEQGAEILAETIISFLTDNLNIQILNEYNSRTSSLSNEIKWKAFKEECDYQNAVTASLKLSPDILLVSGNDLRTLKTCEVLAKELALPICVDKRFDTSDLSTALDRLISTISDENCPKIILVGTSLHAIIGWIKLQNRCDYSIDFDELMNISSKNDTIPTVFISGFSKENNISEWIFDLPQKIN